MHTSVLPALPHFTISYHKMITEGFSLGAVFKGMVGHSYIPCGFSHKHSQNFLLNTHQRCWCSLTVCYSPGAALLSRKMPFILPSVIMTPEITIQISLVLKLINVRWVQSHRVGRCLDQHLKAQSFGLVSSSVFMSSLWYQHQRHQQTFIRGGDLPK